MEKRKHTSLFFVKISGGTRPERTAGRADAMSRCARAHGAPPCNVMLCDHGPVHVDAAAHFDPVRGVAGDVVSEHAGGILADQQVVLLIAVVIARADHEPVVRGELADARVLYQGA